MGLVCKKLLLYNLYMKKEGKYFTIGEVAKRFRLSNRTLRYYEEKGILRPTYGNNGYRYYTNSELVTLDMIRCLRRLDIPIEKIVSRLKENDGRVKESVLELLIAQREEIERRILEEIKRQAYLKAIIWEIDMLEKESIGEVQIKKLPARQKVKFHISSIDSEEEREQYFQQVLSFISKEYGEEYPMLYGIVPKEWGICGNHNYSYIEFESRSKTLNFKKEVVSLSRNKKIQISSEETPPEICLTVAYDTTWDSLLQYYVAVFQYAQLHSLKVKEKLREKWILPRTEEDGKIYIWGSLECPIIE